MNILQGEVMKIEDKEVSVGQTISFKYLKESIVSDTPIEAEYSLENVNGEILHIRDLFTDPIGEKIKFNNKITRSRYLLTIRLNNGQIKNFYHNRMFEIHDNFSTAKKKSWIRRLFGV